MRRSEIAAGNQLVSQLIGIQQRFDAGSATQKVNLLRKLSAELLNARSLIRYHHCLLFLAAFPQSQVMHSLVQKEMMRVAGMAEGIFNGRSKKEMDRLTNSGIAGTALHVSFSFDLVKRLTEKYPSHVSIFSCDADPETIKSVFLSGLHPMEADRFREETFTLQRLIRLLKPRTGITDLQWLVQFIDHIPVTHEIRSHIYDSLRLFITIQLHDMVPSLTTARSLARSTFFFKKELVKKFDPASVLTGKGAVQYKLSSAQKEHIIETARMTLCSLLRETDPVTHAFAGEVALFDMGRGIDVALYPMNHEKKLMLESYIGYMAFRNRIPVAYGGGWIYLHRSKFGLNIFPAQRGGESLYLFAQVLRIYHLHYRVKKFIVEPYQIGKNNTEGLKSGAYWFYYRLGFRSVKPHLREMASSDFRKIESDRLYRSPMALMKKLAGANMELDLSQGKPYPDEPPEVISELITQYINKHHHGKRTAALFSEVMRLKEGKTEREAIFRLQKEARILESLKRRLNSAPSQQ